MGRFSEEEVDDFRKRYGPELVDALLTQIDDLDLDAAYNEALNAVLTFSRGPSGYDRVAIQRREQEVELIKREVRMFDEMSVLLSRINMRYGALTGTGRTPGAGG